MPSRQLTHIENDLLANGLNFSTTSKTLPNKNIIGTIEDAVKDLEKEEADAIRAKISLTGQNSKLPKDNMSKVDVTSLYTNIPIIDTLNIIKDYVNNDDHVTRKRLYLKTSFLI